MADKWNWFDTLPGDVQEEWNAMREIVQAVANGNMVRWRQAWNPWTKELLPVVRSIEIEDRIYQQARALSARTKE